MDINIRFRDASEVEPPIRDAWLTVPVTARRGNHLATHLADLCRKTKAAAVIVHISGYGYQKRGAPVWLLNGIRAWKKEHPGIRLIGIFHELFATGHVWQSSFWLSSAQSYVTRELWRLCDGGLATNQAYFDQLAAWRPTMRDRLKTMPVFSNVGEPDVVVPPSGRPNAYGRIRPPRNRTVGLLRSGLSQVRESSRKSWELRKSLISVLEDRGLQPPSAILLSLL